MQEITEHVYNLLKGSACVRGATGKTSDPYGIYRQFLPEDPDFPVITINYEGDSDGGIEGNMLPMSSDYKFTCWGDNYEDLTSAIYLALQDKTTNSYETYAKIIFCKWVWSGAVMFDTDYNIYYQPVRYRVKLVGI
jgi:hypothetical protein